MTYAAGLSDISFPDRSAVLMGYLLSSPANLEAAIAAWKAELAALGTAGPTEVEFAFARNKMLNATAFRYRNAASVHQYMVTMASYGLPMDQALKILSQLKAATREDLMIVWREDVNTEAFLISMTGPGERHR